MKIVDHLKFSLVLSWELRATILLPIQENQILLRATGLVFILVLKLMKKGGGGMLVSNF